MPSTRTGAVDAGRAEAGGWSFFRRWLLYFVPWAVAIQLGLGFYYQLRSQQDLAAIETATAALTRDGTTVLAQIVQRSMSDLLVLANAGDFATYVDSAKLPPTLTEEWIRFLRIKQVYDQVRFIDQNGREVLRVDYRDGQPAAVAPARLLSQADRPYFRAASQLARGEFHISPFDLKLEGGDVELPIKPTIRFALPVFDRDGQRRGVFVLNYLGQDLLSRLSAVAAPDYAALILLNAQGYWLHGAESSAAWGFMFDRPITLETRYPGTWATLLAREAGRVRDRHGLWAWTTFRPALAVDLPSQVAAAVGVREAPTGSADGEFWKVVARVPAERLDQLQHERRRDFVLALALGLLGLVLVAWRLAEARQRQKVAERELRALNQTLESQVSERTRRLQNEIFDRQMAERRYRESAEQYQHMVATTVDGYWLLDDRGGLLDANQAACRMLGVTREFLLGLSVDELGVGEPGAGLQKRMAEVMLAGSERFETRLRRADQREIDVEISASYLPEYQRFTAFVRDISERKRSEQERRLASMVMNNADEAIFVASAAGEVLSVNPAFAKITGIAQTEAVGLAVDRLGLSSADGKRSLSQLLTVQPGWRAEMRGRRRSGEVYPVWLSATAVRDDDGQIVNYVCVFSDITEIKESQARLDFLAHHDTLTGLPNRLLFRARLEHSLERAGRSKYQIAVMFIDLDHFKDVNDALGHAAGDQLLIDLAGAMTNCLRAEDTLARLGGDEFVVLLEQVSGHDSVDAVLEKFRQVYPWAMGEPGRQIEVTASVGVAIYPDHAADADGLLMKADAAMYRAKENGRNQACYA